MSGQLDPTADLELFAKLVLEALQAGNGALLAALALIGVVAVVRGVFSEALPWLKSDLGAACLTFLLGFLGAVATALAGGAPLSGVLLLTALKVTCSAMGGYSALKKLALPLLSAVAKPFRRGGVGKKTPPYGVEAIVGKLDELP